MLVGIHTSDYKAAKSKAPDLKLGRVFFGANKTTDTPDHFVNQLMAANSPLAAAGLGMYFSFKFPPADVIAGKCDAQIIAGFKYLQTLAKSGRIIYGTTWHEPENDMTGDIFVKMFDRVYAMKAQYAPDIKFGVVNMGYQWRNPRSDAKAWMSFKQADFVHNDVYSGNGEKLQDMPKWNNWLSAVQQYTLVRTVGVAERGYNSKGDQVNVMAADQAYLDGLAGQGLTADLYAYWDAMDSNGVDSYRLASWAQLAKFAKTEAAPPVVIPPDPPADPYPTHSVPISSTDGPVVACNECFSIMGNKRDAQAHYKKLHP